MEQEGVKLPCFKEEVDESQPPHIKEEEEDHRISQEGNRFERPEEIPVICVIVKSEDDEDKGESEEKREVEPPSCGSAQHMITEADGEHCGRSQADHLFAPLLHSDDTSSHSADTDDEDSTADKTSHTDNAHFKCSQCGKTFNAKAFLMRHMRRHTGEKPFACSVCKKSFSRQDYMKRHLKTHTEEKSYSCSICSKGFHESSTLVNHIRTHTGAGDKPRLYDIQKDRYFGWHCIKNRHQSLKDITTWAQEHFKKPLSLNTICGYFYKCKLKLYYAKRKPFINNIQKCRQLLWA
ncbi:zinc finger protein 354C-like isoform X2 [Nerophis ophidion]|uniref:zinc finger protein 354C-like isoform X2 n=1 Tax=Nerophis ophidion TaxID=159077 RepID=UPI002AE0555B|nr:zinc finger protein 354C-like isoform X2 [Nerophis ophidion]